MLYNICVTILGCGITYKSLKYLSAEDIKDAIPNVGLRAEFRVKLFRWRKTEVRPFDHLLTLWADLL